MVRCDGAGDYDFLGELSVWRRRGCRAEEVRRGGEIDWARDERCRALQSERSAIGLDLQHGGLDLRVGFETERSGAILPAFDGCLRESLR